MCRTSTGLEGIFYGSFNYLLLFNKDSEAITLGCDSQHGPKLRGDPSRLPGAPEAERRPGVRNSSLAPWLPLRRSASRSLLPDLFPHSLLEKLKETKSERPFVGGERQSKLQNLHQHSTNQGKCSPRHHHHDGYLGSMEL